MQEGEPLSKEAIDAIMAENGKDIQATRALFADYDGLKAELTAAKSTIAQMEEGNQRAMEEKVRQVEFSYLLKQAVAQKGGRNQKAVEAVAGKGHYKTVKEYPNGGKDVAWVVDVPSVEARQAWDEYEEILRFVPYTADQLAQRRIAELKESLQSTDYLILKVVEGAATLAEIGEAIKQRAAWRREIKELEKTYEKDISVPL